LVLGERNPYKNNESINPITTMGIYTITRFFPDINDRTKYVVIANLDSIIEESDWKRGYVLKAEILQYYSRLVKPEDIGENSYLVEYGWTTYTNTDDTTEMGRIPVR
jgi:hypothetical protein